MRIRSIKYKTVMKSNSYADLPQRGLTHSRIQAVCTVNLHGSFNDGIHKNAYSKVLIGNEKIHTLATTVECSNSGEDCTRPFQPQTNNFITKQRSLSKKSLTKDTSKTLSMYERERGPNILTSTNKENTSSYHMQSSSSSSYLRFRKNILMDTNNKGNQQSSKLKLKMKAAGMSFSAMERASPDLHKNSGDRIQRMSIPCDSKKLDNEPSQQQQHQHSLFQNEAQQQQIQQNPDNNNKINKNTESNYQQIKLISGQVLNQQLDRFQAQLQQICEESRKQAINMNKLSDQLKSIAPLIEGHLEEITKEFYRSLSQIQSRLSWEKTERCREVVNWREVIDGKIMQHQQEREMICEIVQGIQELDIKLNGSNVSGYLSPGDNAY